MPVGDGGGADGDLGRQGRFAGLSICRAVSTSTNLTAGGDGRVTGPLTRVTRAPRLASSAAMACPCLPDDLLAINRTGSIGSTVGPEVTSA